MIQESGVVIKVDGLSAWVETQRKSACDTCSANKACGNAVLNKVMGRKRNVVQVESIQGLLVGDRVVMGMHESALVKGSLAIYIVPLLLMLALALTGEILGQFLFSAKTEAVTILFAAVGLGLGVLWLRYFNIKNRCNRMYHPTVLYKES